jgi:hypothetical protein
VKLRGCQVRHEKWDFDATPGLDQCVYSLTDQRNIFTIAAKLRSRMTEQTLRKCCLVRELMLFAEIQATHGQGFYSFVFSHER